MARKNSVVKQTEAALEQAFAYYAPTPQTVSRQRKISALEQMYAYYTAN